MLNELDTPIKQKHLQVTKKDGVAVGFSEVNLLPDIRPIGFVFGLKFQELQRGFLLEVGLYLGSKITEDCF